MRSTNQIICAVKDREPVTEEELRLALLAMANIEHVVRQDLQKLIDAAEGGWPVQMKLRTECAKQTIPWRFKAIKMPVDQFLGPANIPGTPENAALVAQGKALFKKATGEDL